MLRGFYDFGFIQYLDDDFKKLKIGEKRVVNINDKIICYRREDENSIGILSLFDKNDNSFRSIQKQSTSLNGVLMDYYESAVKENV